MTESRHPDRHRLRDLVPWRRGAGLPPGQRELGVFPRFSDDPLKPPPRLPAEPELVVTGAVERELRLPLPGVVGPARRADVVADFHCVTTWTTRGLRWSGLPFCAFWHHVVEPACGPSPDTSCVVVEGLDGARAVLLLEDALAPDVLLADRLDGEPLTPAHGAPLRLVSPRQYGYKNVKHVHRIEVHAAVPPSTYGPKEHLRARVDLEERHSTTDPRLLRAVYRPLVPLTAAVSAWSLRRGRR
ncbi:molybdopterin-dependent oxidoreductase [Kineococcus sp. SYSU DK002]|uniref:molybdopterin-dependent oxidoreductase n=1 Tax=Kineococcus sp. SYSU DK002 TaxID=3383123 RepID=UPI003D7D8F59